MMRECDGHDDDDGCGGSGEAQLARTMKYNTSAEKKTELILSIKSLKVEPMPRHNSKFSLGAPTSPPVRARRSRLAPARC